METRIVTEKRENIDFPLVAQNKKTGAVVLFSDVQKGTLLITVSDTPVGCYFEDWVSCLNEREWKILDKCTIVFE